MADDGAAFLDAWTLQQDRQAPMTDADAAMLAAQWEADAADNGVSGEALRAAAGGDVAAYLQRTFGREGSEFQLD